jgi:hypothetical protein
LPKRWQGIRADRETLVLIEFQRRKKSTSRAFMTALSRVLGRAARLDSFSGRVPSPSVQKGRAEEGFGGLEAGGRTRTIRCRSRTLTALAGRLCFPRRREATIAASQRPLWTQIILPVRTPTQLYLLSRPTFGSSSSLQRSLPSTRSSRIRFTGGQVSCRFPSAWRRLRTRNQRTTGCPSVGTGSIFPKTRTSSTKGRGLWKPLSAGTLTSS